MKSKHAYVFNDVCKFCGLNHYYLTKFHCVITGDKESLERISLTGSPVELFDKSKTDITIDCDIFKIFPEFIKMYKVKADNETL